MIKKPVKKTAVIHDLSGVGRAALTNIIPVLSIMGLEVCPVPTMILSTHTGGFGKPYIMECSDYVKNAFSHYDKCNIEFDGIFIGYLGTIKNIKDIEMSIKDYKLNNKCIIFDPICGDNGKLYSNFNDEYVNNLKQIIKYSHVITPNYTEACLIAGCDMRNKISEKDILLLCRTISSEYECRNIIITSVPVESDDKIGTFVYTENEYKMIVNKRVTKSYPGTGDIFTSVLFGRFMNGLSLIESAESACEFVSYAISESSKYEYDTKEGILLESCLKELI